MSALAPLVSVLDRKFRLRPKEADILSRSRAVLFVADQLGWPWKAGGILRVMPAVVLDRACDAVARHRYRVYGHYEECPVPRPDVRRRFID